MEEDQMMNVMEEQAIKEGYGDFPEPEEKLNVFNFFKRVQDEKDNSKTANLDIIELGNVKLPVRSYQSLSLYCDKMGMKGLGTLFKDEAQICLATSLSKDAKLITLAVTQKQDKELKTRQHRNVTQNKSWFKKKEQPSAEQM